MIVRICFKYSYLKTIIALQRPYALQNTRLLFLRVTIKILQDLKWENEKYF